MKAIWLEREDGSWILQMPGHLTCLVEIIPVSEERFDVWIMDRARWTSARKLNDAKRESLFCLSGFCQEILESIQDAAEAKHGKAL